jgi:hypothetical protein
MRMQLASTAELIAFFDAVLRVEHEAGEVAHTGRGSPSRVSPIGSALWAAL